MRLSQFCENELQALIGISVSMEVQDAFSDIDMTHVQGRK